MKARRRVLISALCVAIFFAAVAIVVLLRKEAAPEPARLLPESDAVIYVDFSTVRSLTSFDQQPLPQIAPGYEQFVKETGFSFERDLDEAAMAVHRGTTHGATRYTEILVGRYDQIKLSQYLRQRSRAVETYRNVDVFSVPVEDRTVRIALLAIDTVAISNVEDISVVHGIIDRFKKVALPFGGPSLVQIYYPKVPLGSLLWAIARIPAQAAPVPGKPSTPPSFALPGGINIGLPGRSDVVVSLRMLTTIHARADFYTQSQDAARNFTEQTNTFLAVFRGIQTSAAPSPAEADVKSIFDSIKITQKDECAEVTATIPPSFLRKLVNDPAKNAVQGGNAQDSPAKK
jgi:hypothetical protein